MDVAAEKRQGGCAAAEFVDDGMTVGLGTASTAAFFVQAVGARGLKIRCVPTSDATAAMAAEAGLDVPVSTPQEREREQRRAELSGPCPPEVMHDLCPGCSDYMAAERKSAEA